MRERTLLLLGGLVLAGLTTDWLAEGPGPRWLVGSLAGSLLGKPSGRPTVKKTCRRAKIVQSIKYIIKFQNRSAEFPEFRNFNASLRHTSRTCENV
jgi:hypothetical protein